MSSKILLMTAINLIITPSNGASTQTDPVKFVCVGESLSVLWTLKYTDDEVTEVAIINPHDQTYVSQKWKAEPTIYVTRTSLIWNKGSTSDHITFRIENASRDDDGNNELHIYYGGEFEIAHILPLHVLTACPDRQSYLYPAVSYLTKSSRVQPVKNNILELVDPKIVTISVQIPAAYPPVAATVSLGETIHTCKRRAENRSVCEARFIFDTSPNQRLNVTLTFVAWTPSTTIIYVLVKSFPVDTLPATKLTVATSPDPVNSTTSGNTIIIVIVVVVLLLLVIGGLCVLWCCERRRRNKRTPGNNSGAGEQDGCALLPTDKVKNDEELPSVEDYLAKLKSSVSEKVKKRNKALNLPFGIESDKLSYMKLAMVPQRARGDVENYVARSIQSCNEVTSVAIEEMFAPSGPGGLIPRRVLLLGAAGMGKTTVCQEQIRILAEKEQKGNEIMATFFLECRSLASLIQKGNKLSLADLILENYKELREIIPEKTKGEIVKYLEDNQPRVQITVDGLDELAQAEGCIGNESIVGMNEKAPIPDIILNLIKKHLLPNANVFVTSRPTSLVMTGDFDNVIVALGFTKVSINGCLQSICKADITLFDEMIRYIEENGLLMYCVVPLTCVLLGAVLMKELSIKTSGKKIKFTINTMTGLYIRVNLACIWRRVDKPMGSQSETIFDLNDAQRTSLLKLATLASRGMFGEDTVVVFNNKSLLAAEIRPEEENFGLLEVMHEEAVNSEFLNPVSAHFIHLTEQEFLAALCVCLKWEDNDVAKLKASSCKRLDMVRLFVAGLLGDDEGQRLIRSVDKEIRNVTLRKRAENLILDSAGGQLTDKERILNTLLTLTCIREGRLGAIVPQLEKRLLEKALAYQTLKLRFTPGGIPPHHLAAIGYFLQYCRICTGLNLEANSITSQGASSLAKASEGVTGLKYLIMDTNIFGSQGIAALQPIVQANTGLEVLGLRNCQIGYDGVGTLAKTLPNNRMLWELGLSGNDIEDDAATTLAKAIEKCSRLETLWLGSNRIEDSGAAALAKNLKNWPSLRKLDLRKNCIQDQGAKALGDALGECPSLMELGLEKNKIGDDGANALACGISNCQSLKKINLDDNTIGDKGAIALSESLRNSKIRKIKLWMNNVSQEIQERLLLESQEKIIFQQN